MTTNYNTSTAHCVCKDIIANSFPVHFLHKLIFFRLILGHRCQTWTHTAFSFYPHYEQRHFYSPDHMANQTTTMKNDCNLSYLIPTQTSDFSGRFAQIPGTRGFRVVSSTLTLPNLLSSFLFTFVFFIHTKQRYPPVHPYSVLL